MCRVRGHILGGAVLVTILLLTSCGRETGDGAGKGRVTVAAVSFAENQIVAEMYAQVLAKAGYRVHRKFNLQEREKLQPALQRGEVDLAPEYLSTLLTYLDPSAKPSSDAEQTARRLEPLLDKRGLTLLDYAQANDTNALVVTAETAEKFDLSKVSDLEPIASKLVFGGPPTCPHRPFCLPGLQEVYGIEFARFKSLDTGGALTVAALEAGEIDVALLFSTSGVIPARGFVVLEDDKGLQAADNIAPVVRDEVLTDEMAGLLNEVSAALTTENVTMLNSLVEVHNRDPADVARDFLKSRGLV